MQSIVHVKLTPDDGLRPAVLTDEHASCCYGQPVVLIDGETDPRGPGEVESVIAHADCPVALLDAAVSAGYFVRGVCRRA